MSRAALNAGLVLCLTAGAADLLALNLVVLPATRTPGAPRLGPETVARASEPVPVAPSERSEAAAVGPAPVAEALPKQEPVAILEFELASAYVDRRAAQVLRETLAQLREAPAIVVIGHADESGPEQLNDRLSAQRAAAVARRLLGSGIPAGQLHVDARGEHEPRAEGNSRRVEIFLRGAP